MSSCFQPTAPNGNHGILHVNLELLRKSQSTQVKKKSTPYKVTTSHVHFQAIFVESWDLLFLAVKARTRCEIRLCTLTSVHRRCSVVCKSSTVHHIALCHHRGLVGNTRQFSCRGDNFYQALVEVADRKSVV